MTIGCHGKQAHSFTEAKRRVRLMRHRKRVKTKHAGYGRLEMYRCKCCRAWHVGGTSIKEQRDFN